MATLEVLVKLRARIIVLMCASLCLPGRARAAATEMRELYEALADRDAERAVRASSIHLDRSYEAGFQALNAMRPPEGGQTQE